MKRVHALFLILFAVLFSGCGIQMPVTEGLIFSSDEPYGTGNQHFFPGVRIAGTLASTSRIAVTSRLRETTVSEHGSETKNMLNENYLIGPGFPAFAASLGDGRRFAVALSPGVVLAGFHVDATVRTAEKVFFTVNHNVVAKGTELILQRSVYEVITEA